ncbi:YceD family protein [Maribacter sp. ACAM166]|uniref:YceD family protein n=1 Tax=Maribacter sp. ACAM166 TaxID=2508996 RepID=UPI0010FD16B2|nr:DUF177 domain-containing protein [Maribacter sp. ACAM166]TLP73012.1 DUF177 domain-containing protein [Maribacter sp. ACAM166]
MKQKEFSIPFSGLKQGKHNFNFQIDNTFFDSFEYDEFNDANITLDVVLNKTSTMLEVDLEASGTINVDCDITSEPFNQPVDADLHLVVKFGEEYNDEDIEILILPHRENELNITQYVYEMLVLAVPQKRIHPGIEDGTLESEVLNRLKELQPKEKRANKEENDPRWDELKKLLTDK